MKFTNHQIESRLQPRPVRYFDFADSTNDIARDWLLEGAESGSVVIADEQLKGRGRLGRTWHTPPGVALAVSVILRPQVKHLHQISMIGALSIYDLAQQVGAVDAGIKWPNDVQVKGLKLSGILCESEWDGEKLIGSVLGMGLNVRADFTNTELKLRAVSLEPAVDKKLDRLELLAYLLQRIDDWYARIGSLEIFNIWKSRLNMLGETVTVSAADGLFHGLAQDVDEQGALLVRDAQGVVRRVIAGDINLG